MVSDHNTDAIVMRGVAVTVGTDVFLMCSRDDVEQTICDLR